MSEAHWRELIRRFANGRDICNCGNAYYANDGEYWLAGDPAGSPPHQDGKHCKFGCQANILRARDELAEKLLPLVP